MQRESWVFLFLVGAAVIILAAIGSSKMRRDQHNPFSGWTSDDLVQFLNEQPRAVADPSDCTNACRELWLREGQQPTDKLCAVTFCRDNVYYDECVPCRIDRPTYCETEDALLGTLATCEGRNAGDPECDAACEVLMDRQNGRDWTRYCASGYCGRKAKNIGESGYCCNAENFPNMNYCRDMAAAVALTDSVCPGTANDADCIAGCNRAQAAFPEGWDPRGRIELSTGACGANYCFDKYKGKDGLVRGACYTCLLHERELCDEQDLFDVIEAADC